MVHRNSLLSGLFFLILLSAGAYLWLLGLQISQGTLFSEVPHGGLQYFWLAGGPGGTTPLHRHYLMGGLLLVLGTVSGIMIRRHFHRTASTESFFAAAFFFFMSLDFLRLFVPFFFQWSLSFSYSLSLSRGIYGFRIMELLCLLGMGIYALGFEYQKANNVLLVALVLSMALAFLWPLDSQYLADSLIYPLADQPGALFTHLVVISLGLFSLAMAPSPRGEGRRTAEAAVVLLIIVGREATYFPELFLPGFLLLLTGSILLIRVKKKSQA